MKLKKQEEGFTLLEFMVVVTIIGVVAALALPPFQRYYKKSKFTEVTTITTKVKDEITLCYGLYSDMTLCGSGMNNVGAQIGSAATIGLATPQYGLFTAYVGTTIPANYSGGGQFNAGGSTSTALPSPIAPLTVYYNPGGPNNGPATLSYYNGKTYVYDTLGTTVGLVQSQVAPQIPSTSGFNYLDSSGNLVSVSSPTDMCSTANSQANNTMWNTPAQLGSTFLNSTNGANGFSPFGAVLGSSNYYTLYDANGNPVNLPSNATGNTLVNAISATWGTTCSLPTSYVSNSSSPQFGNFNYTAPPFDPNIDQTQLSPGGIGGAAGGGFTLNELAAELLSTIPITYTAGSLNGQTVYTNVCGANYLSGWSDTWSDPANPNTADSSGNVTCNTLSETRNPGDNPWCGAGCASASSNTYTNYANTAALQAYYDNLATTTNANAVSSYMQAQYCQSPYILTPSAADLASINPTIATDIKNATKATNSKYYQSGIYQTALSNLWNSMQTVGVNIPFVPFAMNSSATGTSSTYTVTSSAAYQAYLAVLNNPTQLAAQIQTAASDIVSPPLTITDPVTGTVYNSNKFTDNSCVTTATTTTSSGTSAVVPTSNSISVIGVAVGSTGNPGAGGFQGETITFSGTVDPTSKSLAWTMTLPTF